MRRLAAAIVVTVALAGCAGSGEGVETQLRLVVRDKNIRAEGEECAGARPFHHVHAGAEFAVEDAAGEPLAEGTLPAGRAENAEPEVDWGVERIPTFCVLELDVELPPRARYRLRIGDARPLEFLPPPAGEPAVVLVG